MENSNGKDAVLKYEAPKVTTYTRDQILAELGPAQASTSDTILGDQNMDEH